MKRHLLLFMIMCTALAGMAQGITHEDADMAYLRQQLREAQDIGDRAQQSAIYQNMVLVNLQQQRVGDALACARQAVAVSDPPSESAQLTLALALMQADSLEQAQTCLYQLLESDKHTAKSVCTAYRYLLTLAIGMGNDAEAAAYVDSVCKWDDMLLEQSDGLSKAFYLEMSRKDAENMRREQERYDRHSLFAMMGILVAILLVFLFVLFRMRRNSMRFERELAEQQRQAQAQLQAEQLRHHEEQITAMRNYLDKQVDTMQRIEQLKEGASQHFVMTDRDWQELEGFLDSVEDLFVKRLRQQFPDLSEEAIHLMMLLRLRMPTRSLAVIYGISEKSVKQKLFVYKEKVGLQGGKTSLRDFILSF